MSRIPLALLMSLASLVGGLFFDSLLLPSSTYLRTIGNWSGTAITGGMVPFLTRNESKP